MGRGWAGIATYIAMPVCELQQGVKDRVIDTEN